MTAILEPAFAHVQVYLGGAQPAALELITDTVAALERAGEDEGVETFLRSAEQCPTEDGLLELIRRTVTVI